MKHIGSVRSGIAILEVVIALTIVMVMLTATFSFFRWIDSAKKTSTETIIKNTQLGLEQFKLHTGTYPQALEHLAHPPADQKTASRWRGPYASELLLDGWGNELVYELHGKGHEHPYELYSVGKNARGATEDEYRISVWSLQ